MYQRILIPVENSATDQTILAHVRPLARLTGASLILMHVADGWVARNYENFNLCESDEMRGDRAYLAALEKDLRVEGFTVSSMLAMGEPSAEIVKAAREQRADLIAMTTHGHRLVGDILHGSTADKVRHQVDVPVLLLKARK